MVESKRSKHNYNCNFKKYVLSEKGEKSMSMILYSMTVFPFPFNLSIQNRLTNRWQGNQKKQYHFTINKIIQKCSKRVTVSNFVSYVDRLVQFLWSQIYRCTQTIPEDCSSPHWHHRGSPCTHQHLVNINTLLIQSGHVLLQTVIGAIFFYSWGLMFVDSQNFTGLFAC